MSLRLIEKKADSLGVTVDNGASMNYAAVGKQNGALHGFELSQIDGNLYATKGILMIQGFRIELTAQELLVDLTSFSVPDNEKRKLYLVLDFDSTNRDASFSDPMYVIKKEGEYVQSVQIQNGENGSYYFPLCTFKNNDGVITDFDSLVKQISTSPLMSSSGSSSIAIGSGLQIPQPVLSVVTSSANSNGGHFLNGWLCIGDTTMFDELNKSYKLSIVFYRKLQNAKYRSGNFPKLHTKKSQLVKTSKIAIMKWSDLTTPLFTRGRIDFKKAIMTIQKFIDYFFKDVSTKGHVTSSSYTKNIKATRSKKRKATIYPNHPKHYKHNFAEIAVQVIVSDIAGKELGRSPISNTIFCKPDLTQEMAAFIFKSN